MMPLSLIRHVESAVGQADVIQNIGQLARGMTLRTVFSTRAKICSVSSMRVPGGRAHVEADLAGVHLRKEVRADEWDRAPRTPP